MPGPPVVHIDTIHPDPFNRPDGTGDDIEGLAATIRLFGLLIPLLVKPYPGRPGHWRLVDGHRRMRACELAGLTEVPVTTYRGATPSTSTMLGLILNLQRAQHGPMEVAEAFGRLRRDEHMSGKQIAETLGLSPSTVSYHLGLLELDAPTRERVRAGTVPVGAAHQAIARARAQTRGGPAGRAAAPRPLAPRGPRPKPTYFGATHPLAAKAHQRCKAAGHFASDRYGKVACGPCWEAEIRSDAALGPVRRPA